MKTTGEDAKGLFTLSSGQFLPIALLFLVSIAIRLGMLLLTASPGYTGWYGDVYHHWQIAYYTLHIGLTQSPPRMWDLNGMEYYWGILPALIQAFLFWVFNTASLMPFQIFNSVMGSMSSCVVYLICRRYFSRRVGLVAGFLMAVNPVIVVSDISGMYEPIGILLLLTAVYFYDSKPFFTGVLLGMAAMCRVEYYFLSVAIFACYLIFERSGMKFIPGLIGWLTSSVPHFLWIQMGTGDWLYQLRWNIFSAGGGWDPRYNLPEYQQMLLLPRAVSAVLLVLSGISLLFLLRKRPGGYALPVLFLAYSGLQFVAFSLTSYLAIIIFTPVSRFVVDRMFSLDYTFASWLIAMTIGGFPLVSRGDRYEVESEKLRESLLSGEISQEEHDRRLGRLKSQIGKERETSTLRGPRVIGRWLRLGRRAGIGIFVAFLAVDLALIFPVFTHYREGLPGYYYSEKMAQNILENYRGGTVISGNVFFNYQLVNKGLPYDRIIGSLYSPRYYGVQDQKASLTWLKNLNATWIFVDGRIFEEFPVLQDRLTHPPFYVVIYNVLYQVNQTELSAQLARMQLVCRSASGARFSNPFDQYVEG